MDSIYAAWTYGCIPTSERFAIQGRPSRGKITPFYLEGGGGDCVMTAEAHEVPVSISSGINKNDPTKSNDRSGFQWCATGLVNLCPAFRDTSYHSLSGKSTTWAKTTNETMYILGWGLDSSLCENHHGIHVVDEVKIYWRLPKKTSWQPSLERRCLICELNGVGQQPSIKIQENLQSTSTSIIATMDDVQIMSRFIILGLQHR